MAHSSVIRYYRNTSEAHALAMRNSLCGVVIAIIITVRL